MANLSLLSSSLKLSGRVSLLKLCHYRQLHSFLHSSSSLQQLQSLKFNHIKINTSFLVKRVNLPIQCYSSSSSRDDKISKKQKKPSLSLSSAKGREDKQKEKLGPLASFMNLPKNQDRTTIFGDDSDWIQIYRFPHIRTAKVIQKMKIYQTVFSVFVILPVVFFSSVRGLVGPEVFGMVASGCGLACGMLYVMGNLFANLIGIISVTDKDPEIVRIAHMTFWGTREDELYLKTDFAPFSDLNDNIDDAYVNLKLYSDPEHVLKITLKYGRIYDDEKFFEIFGSTPEFYVTKKKDDVNK